MDQKDVFMNSEGDAWFSRNKQAMDKKTPEMDPLFPLVTKSVNAAREELGRPIDIMEVGCSNGYRIANIAEKFDVNASGIEPSESAVKEANSNGLNVSRGTAEELPYADESLDIVIFGFCLCVCDTDDLFKIAAEADRVLRKNGWVLIFDFYSEGVRQRDWAHKSGLITRKMDYRQLFTWHPNYTCFEHHVLNHSDYLVTDDPDEWIALSLIRKNELVS